MKKILFLISAVFCLTSVLAKDNVSARQLVENSKKKLSLKNVHLMLDLETTGNKGKSKFKSLTVAFAEFGEEKKVKIDILAPDNMAGTQILTTDYPDKKGIIEIFMPATGKVQKIRANRRNMKIIGSEIPIDQFSAVIDADLDFVHIGHADIDRKRCHKVKINNSNGGEYGIAYISVDKERLLRVEQYSSSGKFLSLTELSGYMAIRNMPGKEYPQHISVQNMKSRKSSRMNVKEVNYLEKVKAADFTIKLKGSSFPAKI